MIKCQILVTVGHIRELLISTSHIPLHSMGSVNKDHRLRLELDIWLAMFGSKSNLLVTWIGYMRNLPNTYDWLYAGCQAVIDARGMYAQYFVTTSPRLSGISVTNKNLALNYSRKSVNVAHRFPIVDGKIEFGERRVFSLITAYGVQRRFRYVCQK